MLVKVYGLDNLKKKIQQKIKDVDLMPVIKRGARMVQATAKAIVPVRTGHLRASIRVDHFPELQTSVVFTNVEYAPYVEYGTVKMRAQPYLRPAMEGNKRAIIKMIENYIKNYLQNG